MSSCKYSFLWVVLQSFSSCIKKSGQFNQSNSQQRTCPLSSGNYVVDRKFKPWSARISETWPAESQNTLLHNFNGVSRIVAQEFGGAAGVRSRTLQSMTDFCTSLMFATSTLSFRSYAMHLTSYIRTYTTITR